MTQAPLSYQKMILTLLEYWGDQGCAILQPYDQAMGAGTFHPATTLRAADQHPWKCVYVQPSRRPKDGRYGENPNRFQHYYQMQVLIKPSPQNAQALYLESLKAIGINLLENDIRFVEDDWESPTLGASGLGWEVWCNGAEISQFTYFQQIGGMACDPVSFELTYGLERVAMVLQKCSNGYDLNWNGREGSDKITWGDVYLENEKEFSAYNFEHAPTDMLFRHFEDAEQECRLLLDRRLPLPAYDACIRCSHLFNLLDARGMISVLERASYIARIRTLARDCCVLWKEIRS